MVDTHRTFREPFRWPNWVYDIPLQRADAASPVVCPCAGGCSRYAIDTCLVADKSHLHFHKVERCAWCIQVRLWRYLHWPDGHKSHSAARVRCTLQQLQ